MADNLPLIPSKRGGCEGDVRTLLRAAFRDRCARLPPLAGGGAGRGAGAGPAQREGEQRGRRARRLARPAPHHPYTIHAPPALTSPPGEDQEMEPLGGGDLMPEIHQSAVRNEMLWVRNALARSSPDRFPLEVTGSQLRPPPARLTPRSECRSEQSMSFGKPAERVPPPVPLATPQPKVPEYIVCIPPNLDFINFTLGKIYTHAVRLVNLSPLEVRVSLQPPARRELDVELRGRLQVTSGATTELRVHFRPRDVRSLRDELRVRCSQGRSLRIPIACYIEPPLLEVRVPNLTVSALSCVLDTACSASVGGGRGEGECEAEGVCSEVVDLGARLLGDTHHATLLLRCEFNHASFFLVTEDAWITHSLEEVTTTGTVKAGCFAVWPAWWAGGGALRGSAWCRARSAGLHAAALRVLSSTAVVRPLYLLADALYFHHNHIALQAHEKDYDICSEDDGACEYYVHVGTAFPRRALSAAVTLVNKSPVCYSYYWTARAWGECCCWEEELMMGDFLGAEDDDEHLCVGARESKKTINSSGSGTVPARRAAALRAAGAVRMEPARGAVPARASAAVHVAVPDVGDTLGTNRAVLMLVLRDIPRRSFPPGYRPMIMSSKVVPMSHISGFESGFHEVCEVVCCQMEVWWEVLPLRLVLEPAMVVLPHSRRVSSVELPLRVTQLHPGGNAVAALSGSVAAGPLRLTAGVPAAITARLPLPYLPNEFPATSTITLEAERAEWSAACAVERRASSRHPALRPHGRWLGLVPPGADMKAQLTVINNTYQDIYWWADVFRWHGENPPKERCRDRSPCAACHERRCTCDLLRPLRGGIPCGNSATLRYAVHAPLTDGCVATVVRTRRCAGDLAAVAGVRGAEGRGAVLAYRVLAPRLTLHVLPCDGDPNLCAGSGCELSVAGGCVVRAARALLAGRRSCCRLCVRNTTPLATRVVWEPAIDGEKHLRVIFIPNEFDVGGHDEVEIRVVVEARAVCGRGVWCRRAAVRHAPAPLYLLLDAAISGVEVEYWLPLLDSSFCLRRIQREELPWDEPLPASAAAAFAWEDARRAAVQTHRCRCKSRTMGWVSPPPRPLKWGQKVPSVEIVASVPALTPVCACWQCAPPLGPRPDSLALQMLNVPLRTVRSLRVHMRNASVLTARWSASARYGAEPRRRTLATDGWAERVLAGGACVSVSPARGTLGARAAQDVEVRAYADTWGLYHDQILIMTERLAPLVLDVWLEAVGPPLQFLADAHAATHPTFWVSQQDPARSVRARNSSRAPLAVHAYVLRDHGDPKDAYPFRVCIRLFDVLPRVCPCSYIDDRLSRDSSECSFPGEASSRSSRSEPMDTGVEIYLAPDYGVQCSEYFKVEPRVCEVGAGQTVEWRAALLPPAPAAPAALPVPDHTLLLRIMPTLPRGPEWFRPEPPALLARLRAVARAGRLQLSHGTVVARVSGLELPANDVMRIRKRICVQNVGDGQLLVSARVLDGEEMVAGVAAEARDGEEEGEASSVAKTESLPQQSTSENMLGDAGGRGEDDCGVASGGSGGGLSGGAGAGGGRPEWWLLEGELRGECGAGCAGRRRGRRQRSRQLSLPPHSSTEVCVEVQVSAAAVCPRPARWDEARLAAHSLLSLCARDYDPYCVACLAPRDPHRYERTRRYSSQLHFYDQYNLIKSAELVLELELPALLVEPEVIDFGYVCDGDSRKTYFSVAHTSRTQTVSVYVSWTGGAGFRFSPTRFLLEPGASENVYVQYNARWTGAVTEGWAVARAAGAGGEWCAGGVRVLARSARDLKCHQPTHDHTDHERMLPPPIELLLAAPRAPPAPAPGNAKP